MTTTMYPVLSVMFLITTNVAEFKKLKKDCRRYLVDHGWAPGQAAYQILTAVPRNGCLSDEQVQAIVEIILNETESRGQGPEELPDEPEPMPILSAFYAKYVGGKDVPWGDYQKVADDIAAEITSADLKW